MDAGYAATEKILLYYPTIDIPSPGWIRQGLMYWDKIGSIVPDSYDAHLPRHLRYSDQLQPLYDVSLFRPFNPSDLFNGWEIDNFGLFQKELYETLDSPQFQAKLEPIGKRKFDTPIYQEKVNSGLRGGLVHRELASDKFDDGFVYLEKHTALLYMAILAKYLADIDNQLTIPSTDLKDYESLNFKPSSESDREIICLRAEFRDLLRVPADNVEIEKIIEFRSKRNDELLKFRQEVLDKFEEEIKKCSDAKEIKNKTINFKNQVEKGVRDLNKVLDESKFQTVTGTLKSIFKAPHITTALTAATAAGGISGSIETATLTGVAGLVGSAAIEIFDYFVSRKNNKQDKLRGSAYSYLYLAGKELN